MTEPLYAIGQNVAVCTPDLAIVIPETVVIDRTFVRHGICVSDGGRPFTNTWAYRIAAPVPAERPEWFGEYCLRPINPGEYQDISSSLKAPHSGMEESVP